MPTADSHMQPSATRRSIVKLLKQEGPQEAASLAARLSITAMAVRQHLYALVADKLVTHTTVPRPVGRPAKLWQLTEAANRLFPDAYAELTLDLIQSAVDAFGSVGFERLLNARLLRLKANYCSRIPERRSLADKVQLLAQIRTAEGYMADVEQLSDGGWLLIENHCPICAAARACQGLCGAELELFQSVFGERVSVERTDHIISGARRCTYAIYPKKSKQKRPTNDRLAE